MVVFFKWWFRRRQRILASQRGKGDVEKATPMEKLAAVLHLKNKGGSSTGSSSSSGINCCNGNLLLLLLLLLLKHMLVVVKLLCGQRR